MSNILLQDLREAYDRDDIFYWCNALGEIHMPGEGSVAVSHEAEELPPKVQAVYRKYWKPGDEGCNYVITYQGRLGIGACFLFTEEWMADTVHAKSADVKRYCAKLVDDLRYEMGSENSDPASNYSFFYGEGTDPSGDELLVFIPENSLGTLHGFYRQVEKLRLYSAIENEALLDHVKAVAQTAEEYQKLLGMCKKCKVENCAYSFYGTCRFPMASGHAPVPDKESGRCQQYVPTTH